MDTLEKHAEASPLDAIPQCCGGGVAAGACSVGCKARFLASAALVLTAFALLYRWLPAIAKGMAHGLLRLPQESPLAASVEFFIIETPKVLMLLVVIVFVIGIIRTCFSIEGARRMLAGRREPAGIVLAALLGVVTPFCSCTAVPLFIGFVSAGLPLSVTFAFLISAPMVNEVALGMLLAKFGWQVATVYLCTGLFIAMLSGWIIGRLKMEKSIEPWVLQVQLQQLEGGRERLKIEARVVYAMLATRDMVARIWPAVIIGIAVGAAIHGYLPQERVAPLMGKRAWWSVPLAVLIGVPMYANAAAVVPVVAALWSKGAALGTALAFMMSVTALSLPEAIILRKVLKTRLIVTFFAIVAAGILLMGYLFNLIM